MSELPPPGTGYLVGPSTGAGPGVLLIPSPWGLTSACKQRADELAEAGFTVLTPDLNDGRAASSELEATEVLLALDMNVTASLVQSSMRLLQRASADPRARIGVVGFAAGASWALWLSERFADEIAATVGYYGTQSIRFDEAGAAYLLHFGRDDDLVTDDEIAMLGLNLQMAGLTFHVEHHDGVGHGFAERERPGFDAAAEALAWRQSLEFLAEHLRPAPDR